jgi:hypothetical protein
MKLLGEYDKDVLRVRFGFGGDGGGDGGGGDGGGGDGGDGGDGGGDGGGGGDDSGWGGANDGDGVYGIGPDDEGQVIGTVDVNSDNIDDGLLALAQAIQENTPTPVGTGRVSVETMIGLVQFDTVQNITTVVINNDTQVFYGVSNVTVNGQAVTGTPGNSVSFSDTPNGKAVDVD